MKTVIEMAREAELVYWMSNLAQTNGRWWMDAGEPGEELERFAELVRADEQKKWQDQAMVDIHEAVLDERKQCLHAAEVAASLLNDPIAAIRARSNI